MPDNSSEFPFRVRKEFLSQDEAAFFRVLTELVKGVFFICPKVALSDMFTVMRPNQNLQYSMKLQRKNIDYLLLHHQTLKPVLAIELDHPKQADFRPSDNFMDSLFAEAGLPLIHIIAQQPYNIEVILEEILDALENTTRTNHLKVDYSPTCPRCGITMVLRFDKDGPIAGQKYYGCLNFPACKETLAV